MSENPEENTTNTNTNSNNETPASEASATAEQQTSRPPQSTTPASTPTERDFDRERDFDQNRRRHNNNNNNQGRHNNHKRRNFNNHNSSLSNNRSRGGHHLPQHLPNDDEFEGLGHCPPFQEGTGAMHLNELREKDIKTLAKMAEEMEVQNASSMKKHEIIYALLTKHAEMKEEIYGEGVLEIRPDGFGFLRSPTYNYRPGADDMYVSPSQIRRFGLRTGDTVSGQIRPPKDSEKYFALLKVSEINYRAPDEHKRTVLFDNLVPLYPDQKIELEYHPTNYSTRIIDLFVPQGFGQRCLIVAPPKAGKTVLLQDLANAISANYKDKVKLIVLLVDERPEEVTDMKRNVQAEVVSSTFDEPAANHVEVAEMVIEKAKRLVEAGHHVVILLDSLTRLARAHNTVIPPSGKILSGGVDSNALHKPKRFFGAARNIENGGSLTIIATALIDTGSRMDEVIFEEFKGTGNSEIQLDRKLMEKRVFPCLDINKSATRKEELLMEDKDLQRVYLLRKVLHPMTALDSMEFVKSRITKSKTNTDFLDSMNG